MKNIPRRGPAAHPNRARLGAVAAALLACGAAQAQTSVTIYGVTAAEAVRATNVVTGTALGTQYRLDNSQVSTSRLGFRGAEDLGGGLAATFGLESGIQLDSGASNATFWNRGANVGLRGAFGHVQMGRLWNINDDLMGNYFIFGGYAAFRFTEFGFISDLVNNAVKYTSPTLGGLVVKAMVAAGEGTTGKTYELGGNYAAGPFAAALTYRNAKNTAGTRADKLTSGGVSYAIGPVRLHGAYSSADPKATGLPKATAYDLGVVFTATPALFVTLDVVNRDQKGTINDTRFYRLGADYFLSKRTSIIANLIKMDNKGTASQRFYGSGGAGLDQDVVAVGLRHTF